MTALHEPVDWLGAELSRLQFMINLQLGRCESPIEQTMMLALLRLQGAQWAFNLPAHGPHPFALIDGVEYGPGALHCQHYVGRYRLDFAIVLDRKFIAIEVDGHDFHERTKEQAARDKARDRALITAGWTVLRFSGSEVWRDAFRCVQEVQELLRQDGSGTEASARALACQTVDA